MSTDNNNWDTCAANPYVSEYIRPFKNRKPDESYTWRDVCNETFALTLWKLQEEYQLDYKTAFLLSSQWRCLNYKRLTLLFGKDGYELDESRPKLFELHPEAIELEKQLPKRNLPRLRPSQDIDWLEGPFNE